MMVRIYPFQLTDLKALEVQDRHKWALNLTRASPLIARHHLIGPYNWTAWAPTGRPVACCGILNDGTAWAFLASDMRPYMLGVTRAVRSVLDLHAASRGPVKAELSPGFPEAQRWAKVLGFRPFDGNVWIFD